MMSIRKSGGFTLVEMVVIIAVLAILVTIAAPSFNSFFDHYRVKRAAESVNAFLVNTKSQAVKVNRNVSAVVTVSGSNWCMGMVEMANTTTTCNCFSAGSCQVEGVDRVLNGASFRNVQLSGLSTGHRFQFRPLRGTVVGHETVELTSGDGRAYHVVVSTFGRIRTCSVGGSRGGYPAC